MLSPEVKTAAGSWMNMVFIHPNTFIYIIFTGQARQPKNARNIFCFFTSQTIGQYQTISRQINKLVVPFCT